MFMPTLLSQKWNKLHFGSVDRFQHKSNLWDGPMQNYELIKWIKQRCLRFHQGLCVDLNTTYSYISLPNMTLSAPKHTHSSHQQLSSFKNWKKQSTSLKLEKTSQLSLGILQSSVQVFEWSTASWRHFPRIILEGEDLRDISSASHLEETFLGIAPNLDSLQLGSRNKIIQ